MAKALRGVCYFFSETGTEGGWWAFQDAKFISPEGGWKYEGLHVLKDGDQLTIYALDRPDEVVWSGTISLQLHESFTVEVFGWWIHADQIGYDREAWARFFFQEYPAELVPVNRT